MDTGSHSTIDTDASRFLRPNSESYSSISDCFCSTNQNRALPFKIERPRSCSLLHIAHAAHILSSVLLEMTCFQSRIHSLERRSSHFVWRKVRFHFNAAKRQFFAVDFDVPVAVRLVGEQRRKCDQFYRVRRLGLRLSNVSTHRKHSGRCGPVENCERQIAPQTALEIKKGDAWRFVIEDKIDNTW